MAQQSLNRPDKEGYLEKVGTGITSKFLAGKTKVWCELHGAVLSVFKESKDHGIIKHRHRSSTLSQEVDMNVVQIVRKSSSDKMGNSFEILCNNKAQVFSALSGQECSSWIQHLQRAMTLKDQHEIPLLDTITESVHLGDYEDITTGISTSLMQEDVFREPSNDAPAFRTVSTSSAYAEVDFLNLPTFPSAMQPTENAACSIGSDCKDQDDGNDYALIEKDVRQSSETHEVVLRSSVAVESVSPSSCHPPVSPLSSFSPDQTRPPISPRTVKSLTGPLSPSPLPLNDPSTISPLSPTRRGAAPPTFIPPPPPSFPPPEMETENSGYSIIGLNMKPDGAAENEAKPSFSKPHSTPSSSVPQVVISFSQDNLVPNSSLPQAESGTIEQDSEGYTKVKRRGESLTPVTDVVHEDSEDDYDDDDDNYEDFISEIGAPVSIPEFSSPLTEEDEQPLADLQEFLSNNRKICRPSFKTSSLTEDPIGDLKKLLLSLPV